MNDGGAAPVAERVAALPWQAIADGLAARGFATTGPLLSAEECSALAGLYADEARFRSRVVMARHRFGRGEYKYFASPLPPLVAALRASLYPPLAAVANRWAEALRLRERFPERHQAYLERCRRAGQTRPTPLLLRYGPEDYNCLHQDLYGEQVFPLQATFLLSEPEHDFRGGEFVLAEQRPRQQSRVEVVRLQRGGGVVFAVRHWAAPGARGPVRATLKHGVSRLHSGERFALGIIFHDAA